jgi:hypothetical protein
MLLPGKVRSAHALVAALLLPSSVENPVENLVFI